tara:strand:+ start:590 stop:961 length:372 start_codon:yes stop_codon:yes gene_type:complete
MKISQLKKIIKESVKEAIQEEMKDILIEAVRAPKQVVREIETPTPTNPVAQTNLPEKDKLKLRENMMSVLDGMMPGADGTLSATSANVPLKVQGPIDTTSANGSLPDGNVSMDQIMGLMNSKG